MQQYVSLVINLNKIWSGEWKKKWYLDIHAKLINYANACDNKQAACWLLSYESSAS